MVARKGEFAAEHGVNGPKLGVGSVIPGRGRLVVADLNFVDDADDVLAGVALRVAHDHQQAGVGALEARLLFQLSNGSKNRVFALVNKSARQRPRALHGRVFSLNQQHALAAADRCVSSQCGVEPAVAFVAGGHLTHRSDVLGPGRFVSL